MYRSSPNLVCKVKVVTIQLVKSWLLFIIINVLIKVTLNEICCGGKLQSRWSTLTDSTSLKPEENVNGGDDLTVKRLS